MVFCYKEERVEVCHLHKRWFASTPTCRNEPPSTLNPTTHLSGHHTHPLPLGHDKIEDIVELATANAV